MAEVIDLAKRQSAADTGDVREVGAVPARDLQEIRAKTRLLPLCRDQADALYLYAQILAEIETLARVSPPASGQR
jgi:hypothetical protein